MTTNPDIETDIPGEVYDFFFNLNKAVEKGDTSTLRDLYEVQFEELTKKFYVIGPFQSRPWPALRLQQVSSCFTNKLAEHIYSFLYFKHLFTDHRTLKKEDAQASWSTFAALLEVLPTTECRLPIFMLWDIFDEFVFHMTVVYQQRYFSEEDWSIKQTFTKLDKVIELSDFQDVLKPEDADDNEKLTDKTRALSGFFAIVTRSKINVLLGDYYGALSDLKALDIYEGGRAVLQKVSPANISLLYHIGFSYLMLHRYEDASNSFRRCVMCKAAGRKFSERVQLDAAYLFACARILGGMAVISLNSYLDSRKATALDDDREALRSGDEERFRDVFDRCSPKFLTVPSTNVKSATEGKELQARMFRRAVQQQQEIIKLRGYFGVYQNTKMSLLETLLETDDGYAPLFALKMRSRQLVHDGESADLLSGDFRVSSQYDCIVNGDNVEVIACTNYGGTEQKLLGKIKMIQKDQQRLVRKEHAEKNRANGQQGRGRGRGRGAGGERGRGGRGGRGAQGAARGGRQQRNPRAQAVDPSESLFNRNVN